jgi:hypothetical protein
MIKLINTVLKSVYKNNINDLIKPIINNNNILHVCAMRGMKEDINKIIDRYNDNNININIKNDDGDNILHILFKNGYDDIAIYLINNKKFLSLITNLLFEINNNGNNPLFYCCDRYDTISKILDNINNRDKIINQVNKSNQNIITKLVNNIKEDIQPDNYYKLIIKLIDDIDFSKPNIMPILIYSILNKKNELSKYMIFNDYGITNKNSLNLYPINAACIMNNITLVKLILDKDDDIRNGGVDNLNLPINIALKRNYIDLFELLSKHVKKYDTVDKYDNIYLHYLLNAMILYNAKINKNTLMQYIDNSDLDKKNIKGITPKKLLKDLHKKNKLKIYIKRKTKIHAKNKLNNINIKKRSSMHGLFNSDIMHWYIYFYIILNKYKDVSILKSSKNKSKITNNNIISKPLTYETKLKYMINYVETQYNKLSVNLIIWKTSKLNYINKNFIKSLKKELKSKKRFIIIQLSLMLTINVSHAEIIIIDKKNKSITRFEPYGVDSFEDEYILDKIIKKMVEKITKEKYTYYIPRDYLDSVKFQSVSRDEDETIKKLGDPIGYCLAWCIYFIELRLCNPDIDNNKLVKLGSEKIIEEYKNKENPYLYFIRDYAIYLNEEKDKLLKKIGIDRDDIYDLNYKLDNINKIYKYIIKNMI